MIVIIANKGVSSVSDFPIGGISLWYGLASSVPAGYKICNGLNGTSDLRGKFICGISSTSGFALKDTGGASTHLHAGGGGANEGSGDHNSNVSFSSSGTYSTTASGTSSRAAKGHGHGSTNASIDGGVHSHTQTGVSSLSSSLPPCKKLYWIKRIS